VVQFLITLNEPIEIRSKAPHNNVKNLSKGKDGAVTVVTSAEGLILELT